MSKQQPDPSPEEIAERCAAIQAEWTPEERMKRLRCDLRPQVMTADGRLVDVSTEAYEAHHACEAG